MIKPTPTTCIDTVSGIPNSEHAIGINSSEPPVTPELPHAASDDKNDRRIAVGSDTSIPSVCAVANAIIVIVTAAPSIFIVEPSGIDTEYISRSSPSLSQRLRLTGIFAAELRVKNAVSPLSLIQRNTSG